MPVAELVIAAPASLNARRGEHWTKTRRLKGALQRDLGDLMLAAGVPRPIPGGRVRATARIAFPTARRRDEGNYRDRLEKALGDALSPAQKPSDLAPPARFIDDDTPESFRFGAVSFDVDRTAPAGGLATIRLAWGDELVGELEAELEQLRAELGLSAREEQPGPEPRKRQRRHRVRTAES